MDLTRKAQLDVRGTPFAWAPPDIGAPFELVAVSVVRGQLTEGAWWAALADRVTQMAVHEDDPELVRWACRALGDYVGTTDDPREAGEFLVQGNWNLRTHLTLAMREYPFPAQVQAGDPHAQDAIEECDFALWVELAAAQVAS